MDETKKSRRPLQRIELSVINESFTTNFEENVSPGHAMATKTTNETRVECSADMEEDANTFEFLQQELPEEFVLSIFICSCSYLNRCVRLQCKRA